MSDDYRIIEITAVGLDADLERFVMEIIKKAHQQASGDNREFKVATEEDSAPKGESRELIWDGD